MCFECFKNTFFLDSVGQVFSCIAASVRLCLPGCCAWWAEGGRVVPVFSKGDKMGTTWLGPTQPCCIPTAPSCCQGLAGEGKIPFSTVASHAERSCSLPLWFDQFLTKVLWSTVPFCPWKLCQQSRLCPQFPCTAAWGFDGLLNDAHEGSTLAKLTQTEFVV